MKHTLGEIAILVAVAASAFFAGYVTHKYTDAEIHNAFVEGQRDVTAYVEDCTLELAHAERCTIPCSGDSDCVAKNGNRDNY
jgi:hypothetical protein